MKVRTTPPGPPAAMQFRWPWRPYQQRVLNEIERHLDDRRLHIVAAPGSGKTILGLEVFRWLGKPAVALSPTLTIRDQWLARLSDFLAPGEALPPAWTSNDLRKPGFFTSVSYQALHTKYREAQAKLDEETVEASREEEEAEIGLTATPSADELQEHIRRFRETGVGTLILDEAHHLRREWWQALSHLVSELDEVTLVSLTATPPYDVVGVEWKRYEQLCGPIDAQISVPELVRSGTLCPHQDYILCVPADNQSASEAKRHDRFVKTLLEDLTTDGFFAARVEKHPWLAGGSLDASEVLEQPEFAHALLIYMKTRGKGVPSGLRDLLDCRVEDLPGWERRWCQVLVEEYLFGSTWPPPSLQEEAHREELAKRLRREGLLWRRELRIGISRVVRRRISLSVNKIDACVEICKAEWQLRGDSLRQVVLTDFVGDDDLDMPASDLQRLGAWPVFRALADCLAEDESQRVALVTGRLVVLHKDRMDRLQNLLNNDAELMECTPLSTLPNFRYVCPGGGRRLVGALTQMLGEGDLRVLVGTRALLGEGWDAPCVNSLVLASYVGSFMLTNQMRGRAIRSDPKQPDKAASIWHLMAVVPSAWSGESDLVDLAGRFSTFVGLAAHRPVIESGLPRLALPKVRVGADIEAFNREFMRRLQAHGKLKKRWSEAIDRGSAVGIVPAVYADPPPRQRKFVLERTLRYLLYCAGQTLVGVFAYVVQEARGVSSFREMFWTLMVAAGLGLVVTLPKLVRALWLLIRHLPVDGSVREISSALLDALCSTRLIKTPRQQAGLVVTPLDDGRFSISIAGATYREQSLYADALDELLGVIDNPRYLIVRKRSGWHGQKQDYHAVPYLLGVNKDRAEQLFESWRRHLGWADLVYTRTSEGRRLLLRARSCAFSTATADRNELRNRWQ